MEHIAKGNPGLTLAQVLTCGMERHTLQPGATPSLRTDPAESNTL